MIPNEVTIIAEEISREAARHRYPNLTLPGEFYYVDNNTSGTISIRRGDPVLRAGKDDQADDPIILDFLSNTNRAQTIAHRMNLSHWSVKEPKYAEPASNVPRVPAS